MFSGTLTYTGLETQQASVAGEDLKHVTFTPQTSRYLASMDGNRPTKIEKDHPYTPATFGRGTGFNSDSTFVSWMPTDKVNYSTTTHDAFPDPNKIPEGERMGLKMLNYTRAL